MEKELKKLLIEIVNHLETTSVAVGGLEKTMNISGEVLSLARQQAASDVRKHFAALRARIEALPKEQK